MSNNPFSTVPNTQSCANTSEWQLLTLFVIAVCLLSCERDQIHFGNIRGDWLLEKRWNNTVYTDGIIIDTTVFAGNVRYIISSSDILTKYFTEENNTIRFNMEFKPPDTLIYYSCPINCYCLVSLPIRYTVLKATRTEMIWQRSETYRNQNKELTETLYFSKQY